MHRLVLAVSVALTTALVASPASVAQTMQHDHSTMMQSSPKPGKANFALGEVRKVDRAKGRVVLKHGPLDALGMPPMTMEFVAKDAKLLANVKEGDKVRFIPEQRKDGTLLVSALEVIATDSQTVPAPTPR